MTTPKNHLPCLTQVYAAIQTTLTGVFAHCCKAHPNPTWVGFIFTFTNHTKGGNKETDKKIKMISNVFLEFLVRFWSLFLKKCENSLKIKDWTKVRVVFQISYPRKIPQKLLITQNGPLHVRFQMRLTQTMFLFVSFLKIQTKAMAQSFKILHHSCWLFLVMWNLKGLKPDI